MNVSIIILAYKPNKITLSKIIKKIKDQRYNGKVEIIVLDRGLGFSTQMNMGILKSKYDLVVMLPQDCIPSENTWLRNLISPFSDRNVVASVSSITYPDELWNSLDIFTKSLILNEKGTIVSLLDGKGTAYKRNILKKVNLFDEKTYKSAGEDYDMYLKLKKFGKIAYPNANITHFHPTNLKSRLKKTLQYSNGDGASVKNKWSEMPKWYVRLWKAFPLFGIFGFIVSYPFKKGLLLFPMYCMLIPANHLYYVYGFWKGFLSGKQTFYS